MTMEREKRDPGNEVEMSLDKTEMEGTSLILDYCWYISFSLYLNYTSKLNCAVYAGHLFAREWRVLLKCIQGFH